VQLSERIEKNESNLHFILCKERTGSSLLTAMLNSSNEALAVAEETFSLYLFPKYGNIKKWNDELLLSFFEDFVLMSKKNLDLYFTNVDSARSEFLKLTERECDYLQICIHLYKLFFPNKIKDNVNVFVDKQIDYLFHLDQVQKVFSKSKYVVLVRDPRDNIEACIRRGLGNSNIRYQAYLWNLYYQKVSTKICDDNFLLVKYEDLILRPEKTLKLICKHISVDYSKSMLDYRRGVKELLAFQDGQVEEGFKKEFASFHEGLTKTLDSSKIGSYVNYFSEEELSVIANIVAVNAKDFGYEIEVIKNKWSLKDFWWKTRATIGKKWLLNFYGFLPVKLKLLIKKIRTKKVEV
jgi:hypothetical protein